MATLSIDLDRFFADCLAAIVDGPKHLVDYTGLAQHRDGLLPASLPDAVNVYALWERLPGAEAWLLRYVGQRMEADGHSRLRNHLFHCPPATGSMRPRVEAAVLSGSSIAVTAVHVSPDPLRLAVEEWLLSRVPQEHLWNSKLRADQGGRGRRAGLRSPAISAVRAGRRSRPSTRAT